MKPTAEMFDAWLDVGSSAQLEGLHVRPAGGVASVAVACTIIARLAVW